MKILSKILDLICFVVGTFITVFFIFSFTGSTSSELMGSHGAYYSQESKIGIALGIALICFGILRKYWARKSKEE